MSTEGVAPDKILDKTGVDVDSTVVGTMGVASPSTKRRLEAVEGEHTVVAAKLAKITRNNNNIQLPPSQPHHPPVSEDPIAVTTDFLTTSILARTLLTTASGNGQELILDPLESLKSTLEAIPSPSESLLSPFLKATISSGDNDDEFSLICHEPPLTPVAIVNDLGSLNSSTGGDWSLTVSNGHQVITEDENGKSYFNLGSANASIVTRKANSNSSSMSSSSWVNGGSNCSNPSSIDLDDNTSSSSCESLSSSDDLFNSGEEFDPSDDEEEEFSSYKQQRSTVLHLSLCKLNKFRSQHCVEPSLHRSVLICNTLRHIEQEIKSEDEVDESLKSRERLPSFWRPTSNHHPHCFSSSNSNQPLITDSRPPLLPLPSDPYLSPNPYSSGNNPLNGGSTRDPVSIPSGPGQSPYLYEYGGLRPTPYHTTTYDYEQDLPALEPPTANTSTLLECDSGYGEEIPSYYYPTPPPSTTSTPPTTPTTTSSQNSTSSPTLMSDLASDLPPPATSSSEFLPFTSPPQPSTGSSNSPDRLMCTEKSEFESETDSNNSTTSSSGSSSSPSEGAMMEWSSTTKDVEVPQESPGPALPTPPFAQQDSQCGMQSRRSTQVNFSTHSMPLDNLISSSYSSSL